MSNFFNPRAVATFAAATTLGTLLLGQLAALAAPYKTTIDGKTKVHFDGTPSSELSWSYNLVKPKLVTANACGWAKLTSSATSPVFGVTATNPSINITQAQALGATLANPTCTTVAGVPTDSHASANLLRDNTALYVRTGVGAFTLNVTYNRITKVKLNACGIGAKTISATSPFDTFFVGGTEYSVASLPSKSYPDVCRKVGTASVLYTPVN